MENEGARCPCLRWRSLSVAAAPIRAGTHRRSVFPIQAVRRSRLVQFDTHPTRQIAAGNGRIPGHSSDGSFSIKFDLLPNLQSDSSQSLLRTAEKRHSQAAQPYHHSHPDLTGWNAGRQPESRGSYRAISCQVSALRPHFLLLHHLPALVAVRSFSPAGRKSRPHTMPRCLC